MLGMVYEIPLARLIFRVPFYDIEAVICRALLRRLLFELDVLVGDVREASILVVELMLLLLVARILGIVGIFHLRRRIG